MTTVNDAAGIARPYRVHGAVLAMLLWLGAGGPLESAPSRAAPAATPTAEPTPVVFVPGITGTRLEDPRDGRVIWGTGAQLLRPRDGGYEIVLPLEAEAVRASDGAALSDGPAFIDGTVGAAAHPQARYEAVAPLLEMRIPGWSKPIYGPLVERFEAAGYRLGRLEEPARGDTLFFFNYDWRRGNLESVAKLARELERLAAARRSDRRPEFDLICQSNAARICRYLVKYGSLSLEEAEAGHAPERPFTVRKVVLVGASNDGAMRALQLLTQGRSYIPLVGRRFHPEVFFTLRTLFEDLPAGPEPAFFDARGRALQVDLYEAENWLRYGWSIFTSAARDRLAKAERPDLFGDEDLRAAYLARRLETAQRLHRLLAGESGHFPAVRYYHLENRSSDTMRRALLTAETGSWRIFFGADSRVARQPALRALALAPGDGHATLASQRRLSPQEEGAATGSFLATGGHFEMVIAPESLDALLGFLAD